MKKLTQWIVKTYIKDHQSVNDLKVRARYGFLEGWVSIVGNLVLFVIKLALGFLLRVSL